MREKKDNSGPVCIVLLTVHSACEIQCVLFIKDKFPGFPVSESLPQDSKYM